ncbi:hypothetical protein KKB64_02280 [Patescibacteria group bacterium]|nr:hypothetical protein [Patescibacteria group bacterium]MBU1472596.1 hypothetical protein [Patescibacteria group bacterium]MBU2459848.1 hypothetical protein [Patescibacteria group bacterium]MBU2544091.1 hypothetical protein [Patescibacteria group bacterium]
MAGSPSEKLSRVTEGIPKIGPILNADVHEGILWDTVGDKMGVTPNRAMLIVYGIATLTCGGGGLALWVIEELAKR